MLKTIKDNNRHEEIESILRNIGVDLNLQIHIKRQPRQDYFSYHRSVSNLNAFEKVVWDVVRRYDTMVSIVLSGSYGTRIINICTVRNGIYEETKDYNWDSILEIKELEKEVIPYIRGIVQERLNKNRRARK